MFSGQFFDLLLNFGDDRKVDDVKVDFKLEEVDIFVSYIGNKAECPDTMELFSLYDHREYRRWRHLDTLQFKTSINCKVPRIKTSKGVKTITVPRADPFGRHTYSFERLAMDLLKATKDQTQTAKLLRCGLNVIDRIIHGSVGRGMERRDKDVAFTNLSLDEKSYKKGHQYVTVSSSPLSGRAIDVGQGRDIKAAKALLNKVIAPDNKQAVKTVPMDMWKAYLSSVKDLLPNVDIVRDRFHLVKYLNEAIDKVRRRAVKHQEGLKNSRFVLLKNKANLTDKQHIIFDHIQAANYEVSKVWGAREDFKDIFGSQTLEEAFGLFIKWGASVPGTNIKEPVKVANMSDNHLKGVINALTSSFSNAMAERLNGKIQEIKTAGRGYRTFKNFRSAILFFHGGLNLCPQK